MLVAVRHPHSLAHVAAALEQAADRDVVIMTVRLLGIDVDEETAGGRALTADERRLFSRVAALTERYGRPVRLLIAREGQGQFEVNVTRGPSGNTNMKAGLTR